MRVLQVLPALNAGGVERGTLDFARELVARGHESLVMSSGGARVAQLLDEGSRHLSLPIARKSPFTLWQVFAIRRQLQRWQPDIVHLRSRLPAWLVWLAWRQLPSQQRPHLVSTFHGLYSRNRYSAIMGCGERVIAISDTVKDYIQSAYPQVDTDKIRLVHRGVDTRLFNQQRQPSDHWKAELFRHYPQLRNQRLILMPGRLSRWKGQLEFLQMMAALQQAGVACHGVIVGGAEAGKTHYETELKQQAQALGVQDSVSFLGHRTDIANFYAIADLVCNLSQTPEPFGRTVIEALACGTPVLARDSGGPAEVLQRCFPGGLVSGAEPRQWAQLAETLLNSKATPTLATDFTLQTQADKTLAIYRELVRD